MTQTFLTVSFFVLSWKWYLFGAFLWAYCFWHRKHRVTREASEVDVRDAGRKAYQLGLISGVFAFIVSAPTQWVIVASGFVAGGLLGWAMTCYLTRKQRVQRLPKQTPSIVARQFSSFVFAASFIALAIVAITKLGNPALVAVLILWAAGAGYLFAFGLYLLLVKPNLQVTFLGTA